jgi:hypothetical protein
MERMLRLCLAPAKQIQSHDRSAAGLSGKLFESNHRRNFSMIRFNFIVAAALLGVAAVSATPADAQSRKAKPVAVETDLAPPTQSLGGPIRQGNHCWVTMDQRGFGYWRTCGGDGYQSYASAGKAPTQPMQDETDPYADARARGETMLGSGGGDSASSSSDSSGGGGGGGAGPL